MTEKHACRVCVTGRVQGVWYRKTTQAEAERRQLTGWVQNRSDGSVEALLQGPREDVDSMIAWMHEGPKGAHVSDVATLETEVNEALCGFRIRRD